MRTINMMNMMQHNDYNNDIAQHWVGGCAGWPAVWMDDHGRAQL
jgi:hypothetical protein